jgi:hypothetical protein
MGFAKWDCLIADLWPGNQYVDWVVFDQYATGTKTFNTSISRFYNFLSNTSNSAHNYNSKYWGLAEHGYGNSGSESTQARARQYWVDAKAAIQANTFPKVKMWLVFDTTVNGTQQVGYTFDGQIDIEEQTAFNGFVSAILAKESSEPAPAPAPSPSPPPPSPSPSPSPTPSPPVTPDPDPTPSPSPPSPTPEPIAKTPSGQPIVSAKEKETVKQGELVIVDTSVVTDPEEVAKVAQVEYFSGDQLIQTITEPPFVLDTNPLSPGRHEILQRTTYDDGVVKEERQTINVEGTALAVIWSHPLGKAGLGIILAGVIGALGYLGWRMVKIRVMNGF